ncbi:MAG: enoyl-CoA hydratase/isomerase family protein [Firmicutes bacterium]|nr:enoyl-CoA hydratase/isomerase family protein [Bacillota bacterium]
MPVLDAPLLTEWREGVLLIQLAGPGHLPRLSRVVVMALHEQLVQARTQPGLRGIVLSGTDRAFAVGADLAEVGRLSPREALQYAARGQALMQTIERSPCTVVAAVRGWCLGGGCDLALACHLRVAAFDARFGHPGAALGLMTGWGGTARLPRIVGRARAAELFATGRTLSAAEAHSWGLVVRLTAPEHLLPLACQLARARSSGPG